MNKKVIIEITKFTGALAIGVATAAAFLPAVKKLFKLDETSKNEDPTPSEDLEDEEVSVEE